MKTSVIKPAVISVLGWSGTGKTTFIERAIAECTKRGIETAAIKKSRHEPAYPSAGKDSSRYLKAGARQSLFISEKTYIQETNASSSGIQPLPPGAAENIERWALSQIRGADIIFCEGLQPETQSSADPGRRADLTPKHTLVVLTAGRARTESELKFPLRDVDILITDSPELAQTAAECEKKAFSPDAAASFIEYIIGIED